MREPGTLPTIRQIREAYDMTHLIPAQNNSVRFALDGVPQDRDCACPLSALVIARGTHTLDSLEETQHESVQQGDEYFTAWHVAVRNTLGLNDTQVNGFIAGVDGLEPDVSDTDDPDVYAAAYALGQEAWASIGFLYEDHARNMRDLIESLRDYYDE